MFSSKINDMPIVAIDCEMVGVLQPKNIFTGRTIEINMLARVSIVDYYDNILIDTLVAPQQRPVTNYRTNITGIKPQHLIGAPSFENVSNAVSELLTGKIIVGHALENDLSALKLFYPQKYLRDTAHWERFKYENNGNSPSLKELAKKLLSKDIQKGSHDSIEDAFTALNIYKMHQYSWEMELFLKNKK